MLNFLLFLFWIQNVSTFYVPGVAPNEFKLGQEIFPRVCVFLERSFISKLYDSERNFYSIF